MLLTTILLGTAMHEKWGWSLPVTIMVCGFLLMVDIAFFAANLLKIAEGGWIPLVFGGVIFIIMTTWRKGVLAIRARLASAIAPPDEFLRKLADGTMPRVDGTAVFLSRTAAPVPPLMSWHAKQFGAIQKSLVSLTVRFEEIPRLSWDERVEVEHVADGFWHVTVHFGFMEVPDLTEALACAKEVGCDIDLDKAIYFGARDEIVRSEKGPLLSAWRLKLFSLLNRNAVHLVDRFYLRGGQFVDIGRQLEL